MEFLRLAVRIAPDGDRDFIRRPERAPTGGQTFPSPSLGPPLLSLSPSPPLFWGIPLWVDDLFELIEVAGAAFVVGSFTTEKPLMP